MKIVDGKKLTSDEIISLTIAVLKKGRLVVVPSDTVYGLAADATSKKAVKKLIDFKSRPPGQAISVFVSSLDQAKKYVDIDKKKEKRLKKILPGPFTIVLKSKHKLVVDLESEKGTLGVRLPDFDLIVDLVKEFGRPITATSANLSGRPPHYSTGSLINRLSAKKKQALDLMVDFGKLPRNKPSTVIDLTQDRLKTLRRGDIELSFSGQRSEKFISQTTAETKKIGRFLLRKKIKRTSKKPLIFLIEGELGVGKTVFVKGLGEELGVKKIVSPTFVIFYEYEVTIKKVNKFYHFDLYRIEDAGEFEYLDIEGVLKPKNIIAVEWGEKSAKIFDQLKSKGDLTYIKMRFLGKGKREIESFDI